MVAENIGKDVLLPISKWGGLSECDAMTFDATCHIEEERCNDIANELRKLAPSSASKIITAATVITTFSFGFLSFFLV
jgi:hypothetical protein